MRVGINTYPFILNLNTVTPCIHHHIVTNSAQTAMIFQIFRHQNKVLVEQFLNNVYEEVDPDKDLSTSGMLSLEHLQAMQHLARMRKSADDAGMGFAATFVTPTGFHYTTTNLPGGYQLDDFVQQLLLMPFNDDSIEGVLRLVETEDGIQLQIISETEA
jgi:hypothetical protein